MMMTFTGDFWASFRLTHKNKAGDCDDYAIAVASLLKDDGYPPVILFMESKNRDICHVTFIYDEGTYYRSVGDGLDSKFRSINELVKKAGYYYFSLVDLNSDFPFLDDFTKTSRDLSYLFYNFHPQCHNINQADVTPYIGNIQDHVYEDLNEEPQNIDEAIKDELKTINKRLRRDQYKIQNLYK